jgi:hypothetical protein
MKRLAFFSVALIAVAFVASSSGVSAAGPTPHGKAPKTPDIENCSGLSQPTSGVAVADPANPKAPIKIKTGKFVSDQNGICRPLNLTIQPTNEVPKGVMEGSNAPQSSEESVMTAAAYSEDSVMTAYSVRSNVCDYTVYGDIGLGMWVIAATVRQDYYYETVYGLLSGWSNPVIRAWIPSAGKAFAWKVISQSKPMVSVVKYANWYTRQGPLQLASPIKATYAQKVQVGDVSLELNTTHINLTVLSGPAWHCAYPFSIY